MNAFKILATGLTGSALLSACASRTEPAPAPQRPAPVRQPPAPASPPAAPSGAVDSEAWRDLPLAPGDWSYDAAAGEARYGDFSLRCDSSGRRIVLARAGARGPLRLRTTYGERALPAGASLPAADPLLDELAFSRGRFTVDAPGLATLVLPAWPEPARVIGDCRG